jgi:hypothetical protein
MVEVGGKCFDVFHSDYLRVDAQCRSIITRKSFEALTYGTLRVNDQSEGIGKGYSLPESKIPQQK